MDFKLINDYEILYLIKEGNEDAYILLFKKYEIYLWKIAREFYRYNEKIEDLVQEGRIVLNTCIYAYKEDLGVSFFSFFTICLKREFVRQMDSDYFIEYASFNEDLFIGCDNSLGIIYKSDALLDEKEEMEMYKFIILDGLSLSLYANKKHLPYQKVYHQYVKLVKKIKEKIGL